jgi:hypothetical protein
MRGKRSSSSRSKIRSPIGFPKKALASLSRLDDPVLEDVSVPDFAEPILGWRAWVLVPGTGKRPRLSSVGYPYVWPPGKVMLAECARRRACMPAPGEDCNCGLHALNSLEAVLEDVPRPLWPPLVLGRASLWGRVVVGTRGWRAQFAYPKSLIVMERRPWRFRRRVELESAYKVPVSTLRWSDLQTGAQLLGG